MKVKMKKCGSLFLAGALAVTLVSPAFSTTAEAAKIKLNKTKVYLLKGKTTKLKIKGTKKKVTWKSSNKKVATVSKKGKVKGKKAGRCKVTAILASGRKITFQVVVKK